MSGIVGIVGNNIDKKIIKQMSKEINHRGPDKETIIDVNNFIGAFRFLNTNEVCKELPYKTEQYIMMYDGFIYNKEEIATKLKKDCSLNELIIELFKKYKKNFPKYLKGSFVVFIYDLKTKTAYLARDHFGVKPLYYSKIKDSLVFSSEAKSIVKHPEYKKEFNEKILKTYLEFSFTPTLETFFKDIYRLDAGSILIYKDKIELYKYFELEFNEVQTDEEKIAHKINKTFKDICLTYQSKNKITSFLSSGIDSSYIVSILKPKDTYTATYTKDKYSENNQAKELTDLLKIKNNQKIITKEEYFSNIDKVLHHLDDPSADPAIISLFLISQEVSKKYNVVFSGEGADELFGGYNVYNESYSFELYNKIPFFIRKGIANFFKIFGERRGINLIVRRGQKLEDIYVGVSRGFSEKAARKILNSNKYLESKSLTKPIFDKYQNNSDLVKMQAIDLNFWLSKDILLKADKMTMAASLEARSPFVDQQIYEIARFLSSKLKVDKYQTKKILRKAASKEIPNDSFKKKKLGFPVPLREWMKEDDVYNKILQEFNSKTSKELFNNKILNKMLADNYNSKKDNYKQIWIIYIILRWYKLNF